MIARDKHIGQQTSFDLNLNPDMANLPNGNWPGRLHCGCQAGTQSKPRQRPHVGTE